jgi:hypothetical protein
MELLADIILLRDTVCSSKHCQLVKQALLGMNEYLEHTVWPCSLLNFRGIVNFLVMGSIPASSDIVESEGRQMKQC